MTFSRRDFLACGSGIAVGAALPHVFQQAALAAPKADRPGGSETVLVVIQLTGGNDGLNTVIPYRDPAYRAARPKLKQSSATVRKINRDLGLHSAMQGFATLLEDNRLAIVQGVGYPNSNRSHFESMDIWHKATRSKSQRFGWLGRALPRLGGPAAAMHVGDGEGPLALFSATGHAPQMKSLKDYQLRVGTGRFAEGKRRLIERLAEDGKPGGASRNGLLELVKKSAQQTYQSSRRMQKVAKDRKGKDAAGYPATGLGNRLKLIGKLIGAGVPERIFYTSLDGFDTHAAQAATHPKLLKELSDAVAAFHKDVKAAGQHKRVLVMTFSEFGRRVRENGSEGTDHGAGSQMFFIGETVKPGPLGKHPSLTDLSRGDLKFHTDFRSVYATVLQRWLKVEPGPVLGKKYPPVPLFA
ncbi:MAG: DUF1501 domain-containing protein [Planctomycetaceae bacterium]